MQDIVKAQTEVIKEMAEKSECVIVGRCADYILKDMNPLRLFVYSDMESKIRRCKEKGTIDPKINDKKLAKMIRHIDKQRSDYYEYFTSLKWGDIRNYDLCINTSSKVIKDVEKAIVKMLEN